MFTLIAASTTFTVSLSCLIFVVVTTRRTRKKIDARRAELIAQRTREREHQESYYERRRAEMNEHNRWLAERTRREAGMPDMTAGDWAISVDMARTRLLASLNDEQRHDFLATNEFNVVAKASNRVYRVKGHSFVGNIYLIDDQLDLGVYSDFGGRPDRFPRFCMHLYKGYGYNFPMEDHLLAQALMIRNDEQGFRRIANPM